MSSTTTDNIEDISKRLAETIVETGNLEDIIQYKTGSGRIVQAPIRFTYTQDDRKKARTSIRKSGTSGKTRKSGTSGTSTPITIVLDDVQCSLYSKQSKRLKPNSSAPIQSSKSTFESNIERIITDNISDREKIDQLDNIREDIICGGNFWKTKALLQKYSQILKGSEWWINLQQSIVDRYKNRIKKEIENQMQQIDKKKVTGLKRTRSSSSSSSGGKSHKKTLKKKGKR